jgi:hypothetical protein
MKPFWTSKTFWTMLLGLAVYIVNEQFGLLVPESVIVGVMAVLGIIFRWGSTEKLTVK